MVEEKRFKEAERHSHPKAKEFNLDTAIRLLEEALMLKSDNEKYRQKLDEIREMKSKRDLRFFMQVKHTRAVVLEDGEAGTELTGIVEQGSIQVGDEVEIKGDEGTRRVKISEIASPQKGNGIAGQFVCLGIVGNVKVGDIIEGVSPLDEMPQNMESRLSNGVAVQSGTARRRIRLLLKAVSCILFALLGMWVAVYCLFWEGTDGLQNWGWEGLLFTFVGFLVLLFSFTLFIPAIEYIQQALK